MKKFRVFNILSFVLVILTLGFITGSVGATTAASVFPVNQFAFMDLILNLPDNAGNYQVAGNVWTGAYYYLGASLAILAFVMMLFAVLFGSNRMKAVDMGEDIMNKSNPPALVCMVIAMLCLCMACLSITNGDFSAASHLTFHSGDSVDALGVAVPGSPASYISDAFRSAVMETKNWYPWTTPWGWVLLTLVFTNVSYALYNRLGYFMAFVVAITSYFEVYALQLLHGSPLKRFWFLPGFFALLMELVFIVTIAAKSRIEAGKVSVLVTVAHVLKFAWLAICSGVFGLGFSNFDTDSTFVWLMIGTILIDASLYSLYFLLGKYGKFRDTMINKTL